jgi:hypothetical protein
MENLGEKRFGGRLFGGPPFEKGDLKHTSAASRETKSASLRAKRSNPEKCASKKHGIASSLRSSQ